VSDLTTYFFKGLDEAKSDRVKKETSKAMKELMSSLSVLLDSPKPSPEAETPAPAPAPDAPQGWTPPMALPTAAAGQIVFGGPSAPVPGVTAPAPMPTAAMPAPPQGAGLAEPSAQDTLQKGIFQAIANTGDYVPEAVGLVNKLFGNDFFDPGKKELYAHAPGSVVTDRTGKVLFSVPNKPVRPSFGVSERGWLTTVEEDGKALEHVGVRPMQTEVQTLKNKGAVAAAEARERIARVMAEGRMDQERLRQAGARSLVKYKIDLASASDPKTIQHYYVQLLNAYSVGKADEDDIMMMEYLRPIVEKQGILGTLLQSQDREMPAPAAPPWKEPAAPAPPAPAKSPGIFDRIFNGGNASSAAAPALAKPGRKPKVLQLQGKDGKPMTANLEPDGNYYVRINGQKFKVTPRSK
jgi:hypothetical protein